MRSFLFPAALILSIGGASFASAATTTEGAITAVNRANHSISLSDGGTYLLPQELTLTVKVGDSVSVVYNTNGDRAEALSVSPKSASSVTQGEVASINRANNTITLSEGSRYSVRQDFDQPLKVGDTVAVSSVRMGDSHEARTVAQVSSRNVTEGSVTALNLGARSVTLTDGNTYALAQDFDQPLKVGDAVSVVWGTVGQSLEVVSLSVIAS